MEDADPPRRLYRVGRAPDPLAWPPPNPAGRYGDARNRFRVLYAASERLTAFLETLQVYRPALRDLALLSHAFPAGSADLPFPIGRIPAAFFAKRVAALRVAGGQRFLDVRSPQTHARLRHVMAAELGAAGYRGEFNFGEIIGADYRITQAISRWAYDAGYAGIAYPSTHDVVLTCWAIFDRASLNPVGNPEPIGRDDPDVQAAIDRFGLALPE